MIKKVGQILISKESIIVFIVFFFFQFFRTQTFNIMYYLFDQAFLDGIISDTYTYNYRGKLLGCEQIVIVNKSIAKYNWFQRYGMYYAIFLPSLLAFFLLIKKNWKSKWKYWILTAVSCIGILTAIINFDVLLRVNANFSEKYLRILCTTILFLIFGLYLFFIKMKLKEKIQVIFIAFPAFIFGSFLWYRIVGPYLLPIVI